MAMAMMDKLSSAGRAVYDFYKDVPAGMMRGEPKAWLKFGATAAAIAAVPPLVKFAPVMFNPANMGAGWLEATAYHFSGSIAAAQFSGAGLVAANVGRAVGKPLAEMVYGKDVAKTEQPPVYTTKHEEIAAALIAARGKSNEEIGLKPEHREPAIVELPADRQPYQGLPEAVEVTIPAQEPVLAVAKPELEPRS